MEFKKYKKLYGEVLKKYDDQLSQFGKMMEMTIKYNGVNDLDPTQVLNKIVKTILQYPLDWNWTQDNFSGNYFDDINLPNGMVKIYHEKHNPAKEDIKEIEKLFNFPGKTIH